MKLYNLENFVKLPAGTIYKKSTETELQIKGDWVSDDGRDWACALFAAECADDQDTYIGLMLGDSYPILTESFGRDGCFEDDAEFLVYESWDLEQLRKIIDEAIKVSKPQEFKKAFK